MFLSSNRNMTLSVTYWPSAFIHQTTAIHGTGLAPAGDDELTAQDHLNKVTSILLIARNIKARITYTDSATDSLDATLSYNTWSCCIKG